MEVVCVCHWNYSFIQDVEWKWSKAMGSTCGVVKPFEELHSSYFLLITACLTYNPSNIHPLQRYSLWNVGAVCMSTTIHCVGLNSAEFVKSFTFFHCYTYPSNYVLTTSIQSLEVVCSFLLQIGHYKSTVWASLIEWWMMCVCVLWVTLTRNSVRTLCVCVRMCVCFWLKCALCIVCVLCAIAHTQSPDQCPICPHLSCVCVSVCVCVFACQCVPLLHVG